MDSIRITSNDSLPRTMGLFEQKGVGRLTTMDFLTTLRAVKRMKVETGSMACLGCGFEHNCSVHGCAILRNAAEHMESALANIDHLNALLDQRHTQEGEGK